MKEVTRRGVRLADGKVEEQFDAIILATGYRSNVPSWLKVNIIKHSDAMKRTPLFVFGPAQYYSTPMPSSPCLRPRVTLLLLLHLPLFDRSAILSLFQFPFSCIGDGQRQLVPSPALTHAFQFSRSAPSDRVSDSPWAWALVGRPHHQCGANAYPDSRLWIYT